MTALAGEWNSGMANLTNDVSRSGTNQRNSESDAHHNGADENDLSHLPQWKRDFLMKKRALMLHQQEQVIKIVQQKDSLSTSNGRYVCTIDKQNNSKPFQVHMSTVDISGSITGDKMDECESDDSESSCGNIKSGGYSFITGQQITGVDSDSSSSPSAEEELKLSESDSTTDTSSVDLTYKPGYVSRLLNKWTNISYNKPEATVSLHTKSIPATCKTTAGTNLSSIALVTQTTPPFHSSATHTEKKVPGQQELRQVMEGPVRSNRRSSFRDPVEIVLIENGNGARDDEVFQRQESITDHNLQPTVTPTSITIAATDLLVSDDNR